jgi:hypothetical protein
MTSRTEQIGRTLSRPWVSASAVAAVFVALERVGANVALLVFWRGSPGDEGLWHAVWSGWSIDLMFLIVGVAAGCALWRSAQAGISHDWPTLVIRALIIYIPTRIVMYAVIGFIYALAHGHNFYVFGLHLLS